MIVTLLAIYGVTYLICDSRLLERPRLYLCRRAFLRDLLACYFCTGFWVSLAMFLYLSRDTLPGGLDMVLVYSFAGASVTYLLDVAASSLLSRAAGE